jgi:hypothetical protein
MPATKPRAKRYSISVSGSVYDRLSASMGASASVQKFVDGIVVSALDDATIQARVLSKCRPRAVGKR